MGTFLSSPFLIKPACCNEPAFSFDVPKFQRATWKRRRPLSYGYLHFPYTEFAVKSNLIYDIKRRILLMNCMSFRISVNTILRNKNFNFAFWNANFGKQASGFSYLIFMRSTACMDRWMAQSKNSDQKHDPQPFTPDILGLPGLDLVNEISISLKVSVMF